jgi:hypothetical protein
MPTNYFDNSVISLVIACIICVQLLYGLITFNEFLKCYNIGDSTSFGKILPSYTMCVTTVSIMFNFVTMCSFLAKFFIKNNCSEKNKCYYVYTKILKVLASIIMVASMGIFFEAHLILRCSTNIVVYYIVFDICCILYLTCYQYCKYTDTPDNINHEGTDFRNPINDFANSTQYV